MKIIRPREELRPYVRYYWMLESDAPLSVLTFPIGCPQIIFHRKSPLYIPELGSSQNPFTISGQVNFPAHVQSSGNLEMIVAVFFPHTISMFIDTPPSAFYNREINGYDIVGSPGLHETADRIFDSRNGDDAIAVLEQWLMTKIAPTLNLRRTGKSVELIVRDPYVSVRRLAECACLGKKQYERVFREQVGMNPKEYLRIVRFQRAMRMMQLGFCDYADIAAANGYADQSHFIRDFRQFSGMTPGRLSECRAPYSDLFTNPV